MPGANRRLYRDKPRSVPTMIYLTEAQRAKLETIAKREGYAVSTMGAILLEQAMDLGEPCPSRETLTQR